MKKKFLVFLLIATLTISSFIFSTNAKELDSLAQIAALSRIEPVGTENVNAYTELAEVKANELPSSYSSRDLGYTTPVRQQGSNTCWAYSSTASLETLLLKSGIKAEHFSTQHMNIWGSMEETGIGWQREDLVNDGGYSYIPMGYLTSWSGPLLESEFPVDSEKADFESANSKYSSDYGVTGIRYVNRDTPIETIKSYIMDYGAVVANFNADTTKYMNSTSEGFYCSDSSISTNALYGHAVSIVGWNDDYPKESFSTSYAGDTPENNGAWLIKNSWGTYVNANGGYFWISYEDAWIFHHIFGPSFAISDFEKLDGSKKILQNEVYGATTQFSYLTDEDMVPSGNITYINVFDFDGNDELDSVMFESTSFGADYTLYYIPVYGGKPTKETALWSKLGSGTVDYTGYISVDTNDFDLPDGKGAIGVAVDNTETYRENKDKADYSYIANSIGVCEWLAYSGGYYFKNQGIEGDSFVIYEEFGQPVMYELMDFYDEFFNDPMGGTFVIKAITNDPDFVPETTASEPATTNINPTEKTEPTCSNTITLGITLQFLGNTKLTVVASATGGSGGYEYEFYCNGLLVQPYSDAFCCPMTFSEDGTYVIKVSAKDSGGRAITTQSVVEVKNGALMTPDADNTDPTETTPPETTTAPDVSSSAEATTAPQNAKAYIMGDVDLNGTISIKDTTLIRKYLAKVVELDGVTLALSDVDSSGGCSIKDATLIQKYIALIDAPSMVGQSVMI